MTTGNRFRSFDAESLATELRILGDELARDGNEECRLVHAAAERIETFAGRALPSGAVSEREAVRVQSVATIPATNYTSAYIVALDSNGRLWSIESNSMW